MVDCRTFWKDEEEEEKYVLHRKGGRKELRSCFLLRFMIGCARLTAFSSAVVCYIVIGLGRIPEKCERLFSEDAIPKKWEKMINFFPA